MHLQDNLSQRVLRRPMLELSLTGQPRSWRVREHLYRCSGYGRARWGMDLHAVMETIEREHPKAQASLRHDYDRLTGGQRLELTLPSLPPGPGPARLHYLFDAEYGVLSEVHLHWISGGDPSHEQRLPLVQAATRLAGELMSYRWSGLSTLRGAVRGPGSLLLFSGRDEDGASVEISLDGVAFDVERPGAPGQPEHRPAPRGPAALRLAYRAGGWLKTE
ncbi:MULTISPECIES: hypothetical protein [unclassified Duganella]|uniref:hypothetical protein n=1 Tax=unclassified Duganella TaxID=2636909 RepID=UPI000885D433|nr:MULTISPECIES: hypothetical protein [unclassified Duganella]SDH01721.1 hypothetical protein SAMN05216320_1093 [Duganella sp. OV458]SDK24457.1 hypothetical protein SAMN05428973_109279 [Duganella sp. OV510]